MGSRKLYWTDERITGGDNPVELVLTISGSQTDYDWSEIDLKGPLVSALRARRNIGVFRTPTLRDVELTWPYMHDGSLGTLLDVVMFYNRGGNGNPSLGEKMRPLNLGDEEMNSLVEFVRALTSEDVLREAQTVKPQPRRNPEIRLAL